MSATPATEPMTTPTIPAGRRVGPELVESVAWEDAAVEDEDGAEEDEEVGKFVVEKTRLREVAFQLGSRSLPDVSTAGSTAVSAIYFCRS